MEALIKEAELDGLLDPGIGRAMYAFQDGETQLYPIGTRAKVEKSAEHFVDPQNRWKLPFKWRREIAQNLLKAGERMRADLSDRQYVLKAAGRGSANPRQLAEGILLRVTRVPDDVERDLRKLALDVEDAEPGPKTSAVCAEALGEVDETSGLYRQYRRGFPTPEESCFVITQDDVEKVASAFIQLPNGEMITAGQIERAPRAKMARAIGGRLEDEFLRRPDDTETFKEAALRLPPDDADTLCAMLPERELDCSLDL